MRVHIQFTKPNEIIPYNHQEVLTGAFHKWIGKNIIHNDISLYSFSRLSGAKADKKGLTFPFGAKWFISIYDKELFKKLLSGIVESPEIRWGMKVQDFFVQPEPDFTHQTEFYAASPIFIKRSINNRQKHYLFSDKESSELLTETLIHKMKVAGLNENDVKVEFNLKSSKPKTAKVTYNGIDNRASICPVNIIANNEIKAFAWNVGLGNSTGIGFGAIS
ncbi:MAG: CRISPR-associated endoribonuclease Cas6 [bacterium]